MRDDRPLSVTGAVVRFLLGSLAAIAVLLAGVAYVLRETGISESQRNSRQFAALAGQAIVEPAITRGVLDGDPDALAELDTVVQERILAGLTDRIARIKIWDATGRIVYSDEPRLIGERFPLGEDELHSLRTGEVDVDVSDLSEPENRYERNEDTLLEVYLPLRGPDGEQLLFELYERRSSIEAGGARLLRSLAPWLLLTGIVLLVVQAPLAWSLARRVRRGQEERERLLVRAVQSSALERRRIAADLHDGVVQDLAGIAFGLEAVAAQDGTPATSSRVREAVDGLRRSIRRLRTLLVEIHPANLRAVGLEAALEDVASPLRAHGVESRIAIEADDLGVDDEALVFRVAQEALRNVSEHADATCVDVRLDRSAAGLRLLVTDDGRGFSPEQREQSEDDGHVGLTLLEGIVRDAGGSLTVTSAAGEGTTVSLEVPER